MSRSNGIIRKRGRSGRAWLGALLASSIAVAVTPSPAQGAFTLSHFRNIGQNVDGHAFLYAWGAETLPSGDVLIGDYWNYSVKRFRSNGHFVTELLEDTQGSARGSHLAPYGIAVQPNGRAFFVGDVDAQRTVDKYRTNGTFLFDFGGPSRYSYPAYPAVTSDRRIVVADSRSHRISVTNAAGEELFRFGTTGDGPGQFRTPRGIDICHRCAPHGDDWLYVADSGNARGQIWLLRRGGTSPASVEFLSTFGGARFGGANLRGLAVDEERGFVYVVDAFTGFTDKFDLQGNYLSRFGGKGRGPGRFPTGGRSVTVDGRGRIWVSDLAQFRVHVFSRKGVYRFQVPRAPQPPALGGFNTPSDVAVDEQGYIWVIDTMNQRFQKFSRGGVALDEWGLRGGPQAYGFNYPRGIAVDDSGPNCPTYTCVIVADSDTGSIVKFDADGEFLWSYGAGTAPEGQHKAWSLAVDPDGRIYAAELGQHDVLVLSPSGNPLDTFGAARLDDPRGISVDPSDGSIWVADRVTNTVQHFDSWDGDLDFLGEIVLNDDTLVQQAMDVQVSGTHVYVTDTKGNKILVWEKNGTFVGIAAQASGAGSVLGPMGMDIADGHLYVAETVNERIHDFTITG